eukprot:741197_1
MVYQQKLKHKSSLKANAITNSDDHKENEAATQKIIKEISGRLKRSQNQVEQFNSSLEKRDDTIKAIESKYDAICKSSNSKIEEYKREIEQIRSKEKEHAADTKQKDETIHDLRQENESSKSKIEDH